MADGTVEVKKVWTLDTNPLTIPSAPLMTDPTVLPRLTKNVITFWMAGSSTVVKNDTICGITAPATDMMVENTVVKMVASVWTMGVSTAMACGIT